MARGRPPSGAGRSGKPVRLAPDLHAALSAYAAAEGITLPVAAERLLRAALESR